MYRIQLTGPYDIIPEPRRSPSEAWGNCMRPCIIAFHGVASTIYYITIPHYTLGASSEIRFHLFQIHPDFTDHGLPPTWDTLASLNGNYSFVRFLNTDEFVAFSGTDA